MLEEKAFILVTGASKGFGRSVAVALAKNCNFKGGSEMVLVARNEDGLQKTRNCVLAANSILSVRTVVCDLGRLEALDQAISKALPENHESYATAVLINNAGSIGNIREPARSHTSAEEIQAYFDLNVTSVFSLTARFLSHFSPTSKVIVNVSSLTAVQAMPYMSAYCTGKAARDMLHQCLACEEEDARVLNYAPGPMDTDMSIDIQNNCGNEVSRTFFKEMREKGTILKTDDSAEKLVRILKGNDFKSGAHIDFYDIE